MAKTLNYCRPEEPANRRLRESGAAIVLGLVAGGCFVLPFGLFQLGDWLYPDEKGRIAMVIAVPVMMLWLASGILGLCGAVVGGRALWRGKTGIWTIVATSICGVLMLIVAAHIVRGIVRNM